MDCSLPGSSLHGILQARVLECVAISFSRGSSQPRDRTLVSHIPGRRFNLWATREAQEDVGQKQPKWDFPGGPVVKTLLTIQGPQVWFLVRELSSLRQEKKKSGREPFLWFWIDLQDTLLGKKSSKIQKRKKAALVKDKRFHARLTHGQILFCTKWTLVRTQGSYLIPLCLHFLR